MTYDKPSSLAWAYLLSHKLRFIFAVFWRVLYELAPMQLPVLTGIIIDGLSGTQMGLWGLGQYFEGKGGVLSFAAMGLLTIALLHAVSSYNWTLANARLSRGFVTQLRRRLINHVMNLSLDRHAGIGSAGLIDRILRDTGATRSFIEKVFVRTLTNLLRAGYPLLMLLILDFWLAIMALAVLPIQYLISRKLEQRLRGSIKRRRESDAALLAALKEDLDGIDTIQTLNAANNAAGLLKERVDRLEQKQIKVSRVAALMRLTVWSSTGIGLALTWWQGGLKVMAGQMTMGELVIFTGLVTFAYRPFRQFSKIVKVYHRGWVSLERICELLRVQSRVQDRPGALPLEVKHGRVSIQGVSFAYDLDPVLSEVSLQIASNQLVAVVGRSGSGKSTLLKLLARLYDPQEGEIRIDDQPIQGITLSSLRSQVILMGQDPAMFCGSILQNIRLAVPEASMTKVRAASRLAAALPYIELLDDGFDTQYGTGGTKLSGGQIQRIALARALLPGPEILLLDEPTSALDSETEAAILKSLEQLKQHTTIIMTAHRAPLVRKADQIIVMEQGRAVSQGSYEHLEKHCKVFRGLFSENQVISLAARI